MKIDLCSQEISAVETAITVPRMVVSWWSVLVGLWCVSAGSCSLLVGSSYSKYLLANLTGQYSSSFTSPSDRANIDVFQWLISTYQIMTCFEFTYIQKQRSNKIATSPGFWNSDIFIRWRPSSDWWICHSASAYIWTSNYVLLIHHNLDYLIAKQNFQTQNLKLIKNWQKVSPKLLKFWKIIENTLNIENNRTDSQMICNKILTKFASADLYTLEKTVV